MSSRNRMKIQTSKLNLRPFWLADFCALRRLHMAIQKSKENSFLLKVLINGTQKILKIFSPIPNSIMGLKNIVKKNIFKTFTSVRSLEEPNEVFEGKKKLRRYKYHRTSHGKKPKEICTTLEDGNTIKGNGTEPTLVTKKYNTRQSARQRKECGSCDEDYTASQTCSSCLNRDLTLPSSSCVHCQMKGPVVNLCTKFHNKHPVEHLHENATNEDYTASQSCSSCFNRDPTLPSSSCVHCQRKGPVVNLCTKFHNKHPVVHLHENATNEDLFDKFQQRRELIKDVSKFCKGHAPKINHCPMCPMIQPQIGECSCKNCNQIQPIVKLAKRNKNTFVEMCPCQLCSRLRLKVKVCDHCKNTQINKAKSYYVILSSK